MNQLTKNWYFALCVIVAAIATASTRAADIGTAFTYQGTLENGSGPVTDTCDFRFGLWRDAASVLPADQVGTLQNVSGVEVVAGVFTTTIDFGAGSIDGTARWLAIEVQCPADGDFVALSPRVELTAAPHALALPNLRTEPAGPNGEGYTGANIIGGAIVNTVGPGVVGAVVLGGGYGPGGENTATGDFTTVSGGRNNIASGDYSTVGGGLSNNPTGEFSTIGGGLGNDTAASGDYSTIGGGTSCSASGLASTVCGGSSNFAGAHYATVLGGHRNFANGVFSLAAGRSAKVRAAFEVGGVDTDGDEGTFAWADSTGPDFISTGPNQFLIRATGGMRLATGNGSTPRLQSILPSTDTPAPLALNPLGGNVGLGTSNPVNRLDVEGGAAIGATYSGTNTAPTNGLLVQGSVGLGTTAPMNKMDVEGSVAIGEEYSGSNTAPANGLLVQGNVGIGLTIPETLLHVNGEATFELASGGGSGSLAISTPGGWPGVLVLAENGNRRDIRFTDSGISLLTSASPSGPAAASGIIVNEAGLVGIGTASHANRLDVEGGMAIGAGYSGISVAPPNGLLIEGNVGIGTATSANKLDVEGAVAIGTTVSGTVFAPTNGLLVEGMVQLEGISTMDVNNSSTTGVLRIGGGTSLNLGFDGDEIQARSSGSASNLYLNLAGGNVGIGTATAVNKLDVEGAVAIGTGVSGTAVVPANGLIVEGSAGIGRPPAANKLEVEGSASKTTAGDWLANSDAAIKTDVRTVTHALSMIERLRPVAFRYTEEYKSKHPSVKDQDYYNYIAQEFREVFPDWVKDSGEEGILQMDSYPASVYAVAAIQELHQIVQDKECEIDNLKSEIDQLKLLVKALADRQHEGDQK